MTSDHIMRQLAVGGLMTALREGIQGVKYLTYCCDKARGSRDGVFRDNLFLDEARWHTQVNLQDNELLWKVAFTDTSLGVVVFCSALSEPKSRTLSWSINEAPAWGAHDKTFRRMMAKLLTISRGYATSHWLDESSALMQAILL